MRRARGFSLVELLVVLTLVAVLAVLAAPAGRSVLPGFEARAAAEAFAAEARRARAEAVFEAREGWIEVDLVERRYRRAGAPWIALRDDLSIELVTARSEIVENGRGRIRFFPGGEATGGFVAVDGDGRRFQITVDWLTGVVAVQEDEIG